MPDMNSEDLDECVAHMEQRLLEHMDKRSKAGSNQSLLNTTFWKNFVNDEKIVKSEIARRVKERKLRETNNKEYEEEETDDEKTGQYASTPGAASTVQGAHTRDLKRDSDAGDMDENENEEQVRPQKIIKIKQESDDSERISPRFGPLPATGMDDPMMINDDDPASVGMQPDSAETPTSFDKCIHCSLPRKCYEVGCPSQHLQCYKCLSASFRRWQLGSQETCGGEDTCQGFMQSTFVWAFPKEVDVHVQGYRTLHAVETGVRKPGGPDKQKYCVHCGEEESRDHLVLIPEKHKLCEHDYCLDCIPAIYNVGQNKSCSFPNCHAHLGNYRSVLAELQKNDASILISIPLDLAQQDDHAFQAAKAVVEEKFSAAELSELTDSVLRDAVKKVVEWMDEVNPAHVIDEFTKIVKQTRPGAALASHASIVELSEHTETPAEFVDAEEHIDAQSMVVNLQRLLFYHALYRKIEQLGGKDGKNKKAQTTFYDGLVAKKQLSTFARRSKATIRHSYKTMKKIGGFISEYRERYGDGFIVIATCIQCFDSKTVLRLDHLKHTLLFNAIENSPLISHFEQMCSLAASYFGDFLSSDPATLHKAMRLTINDLRRDVLPLLPAVGSDSQSAINGNEQDDE